MLLLRRYGASERSGLSQPVLAHQLHYATVVTRVRLERGNDFLLRSSFRT